MNQSEVKIFSAGSIIIGTFVWIIPYLFYGFNVFSFESLKYINLGITLAGLFWFSYFKWAWKWSYIGKLLYRPNLNGTWIGEFESDWKDKQGKVYPPKKFVLVIRQHWFTISIRAFTNIQKTESYVETLMLDESKGVKILAYLFSEKRSNTGEHGTRQGAAELDLIESQKNKLLEGHFWTQASTRGYIKVNHVSNTYHVESFEQAENKWQKSVDWASIKKGELSS